MLESNTGRCCADELPGMPPPRTSHHIGPHGIQAEAPHLQAKKDRISRMNWIRDFQALKSHPVNPVHLVETQSSTTSRCRWSTRGGIAISIRCRDDSGAAGLPRRAPAVPRRDGIAKCVVHPVASTVPVMRHFVQQRRRAMSSNSHGWRPGKYHSHFVTFRAFVRCATSCRRDQRWQTPAFPRVCLREHLDAECLSGAALPNSARDKRSLHRKP
jgi:hypothetical protein